MNTATRHRFASAVVMGFFALTARAADPFVDWPAGKSPREVGTQVTQRFIATEHFIHQEFKTIHYAEVAAWYGGLTFARLADDHTLTGQLVARFEPLFGSEQSLAPPVVHVDHSVFGAVPLELYRQTGYAKYRTLGLAYADGQWDNPQPDGLTRQTRYWIDDMYMITLLQAQAYRATGEMKYLDRAATEMVSYLERLQQPNGLFHHAPASPFFWGRGNGWVAAGMTELLTALPENHPQRRRILAGYRSMMASLLKHQSDTGMWRQLIDHPESWPESSSTGMFTFAFVTGVKQGWLDAATYGPAARKAWLALTGYIDASGDVAEVCVGTGAGDSVQYYLDRPRSRGDLHGQAPILWSASALLR
ncbi:MAG TPA: glycoside hydrolase family 88 protein [Povalibacter sp.]|jgi:rhamnogalacturonyl hydrolase YesR|nr:glycoside hydrolase family 88 protein [Povalibacter sp.]